MSDRDEWDDLAEVLIPEQPFIRTVVVQVVAGQLRSAAERSAGERHPGTEPPDTGRWVLGGYDGIGWLVMRYVYTGRPHWVDSSGDALAPDFWQELPPIDRDGRRKGGGG